MSGVILGKYKLSTGTLALAHNHNTNPPYH